MNASNTTKAAYFNYIGSIELPADICKMIPPTGPPDKYLNKMRKLPEVIAELSVIDADALRRELSMYGAWEAHELSNHNDNLDRILWIACSMIQDELM